jgi:hypothetical protein
MATDTGDVRTQARAQIEQTAHTVQAQATGRVHRQVATQSTKLGDQAGSFAQALTRAGEHLDVEGNEQGARAAHQAAQQADRVARYLRESDSNRLLGDVERITRRRPWLAGGVGALLGFAASRFLKASSEQRYESSQGTFGTPRTGWDADYPMSREAPMADLQPPATPMFEDGADTRFA